MKLLSLFSGIGTTELAARKLGFETAAFCEIDSFAQSILRKRFPGVPICTDIRSMKGDEFGTVDAVFGGFPCQDLSVAGRRAGLEGERSGLWFEMLRIVRNIRPRYVLAENVRGAINLALDTVTVGLEGAGYEVRTSLLPASLFGAPHQRYRIFILGVRRDVADALADVPRERLERICKHGTLSEQGTQPDDRNAVGGGASLWRTPDANAGRGANSEQTYQKRKAQGLPLTLNTQVAHVERSLWPTPIVSAQYLKLDPTHHRGEGIITVVRRQGDAGPLNPNWVEILQGLPIGWTDPDCNNPAPWRGWPAPPDMGGQYAYEPPRTARGVKNRSARLKALGNCNPPQMYAPFLMAIKIMEEVANGYRT